MWEYIMKKRSPAGTVEMNVWTWQLGSKIWAMYLESMIWYWGFIRCVVPTGAQAVARKRVYITKSSAGATEP